MAGSEHKNPPLGKNESGKEPTGYCLSFLIAMVAVIFVLGGWKLIEIILGVVL
jgi:hypothetical protein